ncbi:hypothetical protein FHX42_004472 [Saccharopolyspora lacisalsi]|uniref:Uncharacterized protein n=1 Tax=Halosaccharopolyspora lacisalsi TaxID=1000566 RepID=A0A839E897_9PSEU|nr:hypothetical protein [Halosaccharopolyspora lacisalsi]MBA8827088.1 hypothetical protein [Halosaccharopolyspora lacisalsi]
MHDQRFGFPARVFPIASEVSADVAEPLLEERLALRSDEEGLEHELELIDAECAVLRAEEAGVTDAVAMRRLERARAADRNELAARQWQRTDHDDFQAEEAIA